MSDNVVKFDSSRPPTAEELARLPAEHPSKRIARVPCLLLEEALGIRPENPARVIQFPNTSAVDSESTASTADFSIENHGSLFLFRCNSAAAKAHLEQATSSESYQWVECVGR